MLCCAYHRTICTLTPITVTSFSWPPYLWRLDPHIRETHSHLYLHVLCTNHLIFYTLRSIPVTLFSWPVTLFSWPLYLHPWLPESTQVYHAYSTTSVYRLTHSLTPLQPLSQHLSLYPTTSYHPIHTTLPQLKSILKPIPNTLSIPTLLNSTLTLYPTYILT